MDMDTKKFKPAADHYTALFRKNQCPDLYRSMIEDNFIIDQEDSRSIISEIVYPKLRSESKWIHYYDSTFYGCPRSSSLSNKICNKRLRFECSKICLDVLVLRSMCKKHESNLNWSLKFVKNRIDIGDECSGSMSLLCMLFDVAVAQQQWDLINNYMAKLLCHPRTDIRGSTNRVFLHIVRPDAGNLERLTEHFEIMIKMFNDPSEEVKKQNRYVWQILSQSRRIGPQGYKLMRTIMDLWLLELDMKVDVSVPDWRESHLCKQKEALTNYTWLMMPRLESDSDRIDYHSVSNRIIQDILRIKDRGIELFDDFRDLYPDVVKKHCTDKERNIRFRLIFNRVDWLAFRNGFDYWFAWPENITWKGFRVIERVDYQDIWNTLMEIYEDVSINPVKNQTKPDISDVPVHNKDEITDYLRRMSAAIGMPEIGISAKIYGLTSRHIHLSDMTRSSHIGFRENLRNSIDALYSRYRKVKKQHSFRGIQPRRLAVIFLCGKITSAPDGEPRDWPYQRDWTLERERDCWAFDGRSYLRVIINLLEELRAAYASRMAQKCTVNDREKFLLPTCLELALPIPFDDPASKIYLCEFAFFRETLDHLEKKNSKLFRFLCSSLSDEDKNQLHYYRYKYNDFHICCSAMRSDGEQFQCIRHRSLRPDSDQGICPIIGRKSN